jgi:hypothetical protein
MSMPDLQIQIFIKSPKPEWNELLAVPVIMGTTKRIAVLLRNGK